MASNQPIETFGFENEDIKSGLYDKYKGKKGEVHRAAIVYTDPKAMFAGAKAHFNQRFFLCKNDICCKRCGPAKWRVGAVLCKYNTDKQGMPKKPFGYELLPWIFSEQTYTKLKNTNSEFPLASHDIKISCTNDEYQHLDINPCQESLWQGKEEIKSRILEEAKPVWDFIKKSIAQDMTIEEIKELLGLSSGAGSDPTQKLDLDSVLDEA